MALTSRIISSVVGASSICVMNSEAVKKSPDRSEVVPKRDWQGAKAPKLGSVASYMTRFWCFCNAASRDLGGPPQQVGYFFTASQSPVKAIGRKEYTKLRRIFVQIQGARQALSPLANCRATHKLDDKDKQVGIFFDRNRLTPPVYTKSGVLPNVKLRNRLAK
uniref:Uncharacterized protein n=1 Tax=Candidatus Kentrum sp. FM TaxID=2126340 RepID=A0A450TYQ2_9GAMM|nr:MAG: hypothetical protein BECKFM1743C_GA0114222_108191 [Candidatus Kentron sp. FM]VFJ75321.1 MAG: hypothetical protein BECKFM1743A_GA0114220_108252 [Candidatus Kentron sp. FM]VFK21833.1 MAG: hypothetical protein BECKFM1743B_GA0114221_108202 [Candidatus Kentron sp. FM]